MKLERRFYDRPTLDVACELLGKYLVRVKGRRAFTGRIAETEAYVGPADRASHASRGRTERTEPMFGPPGFTYVYLVYGMHHCLNLVTEREGYPAAVLVRALEPVDGEEAGLLSGPGRLCRAFEIDRTLNRMDLCGNVIWVEDRGGPAPPVGRSARIGVDYAGPWAKRPWRFFIEGSPAVSRAPRRRAA